MLSLAVNNKPIVVTIPEGCTLEQLLSLVKAAIPGDEVVTSASFNGRAIDFDLWQALASELSGELQFVTANKMEHLRRQIPAAARYLDQIEANLRNSVANLRSGDFAAGNSLLATSVDELLAFIKWYLSLLQMDPEYLQQELLSFSELVSSLQRSCEALVTPHMNSSWTSVAELVESELLDKLIDLRSMAFTLSQTLTQTDSNS